MHLSIYLLSSFISLHYAEVVRNFRVDTFRINEIVQHLVKAAGFIERGTIKNDDPIDPYRVAYELNL